MAEWKCVNAARYFSNNLVISPQIAFPVHCLKSVRIWSYFGPYFPAIRTEYGNDVGRMQENTDQNNSEYGHFYAVVVSSVSEKLEAAVRRCSSK